MPFSSEELNMISSWKKKTLFKHFQLTFSLNRDLWKFCRNVVCIYSKCVGDTGPVKHIVPTKNTVQNAPYRLKETDGFWWRSRII